MLFNGKPSNVVENIKSEINELIGEDFIDDVNIHIKNDEDILEGNVQESRYTKLSSVQMYLLFSHFGICIAFFLNI